MILRFCLLFLVSGLSMADVFVESAQTVGIDFVHFNGMSGRLYYPETMGSGAALLDYDDDGDLDIYLVQGNYLTSEANTVPIFKPQGELRDRLYRNDSEREGPLRFTEVTKESGIDARGYGMGVAVGDVNNDGAPDIYVTNLDTNELWLNQGDGTFKNVSSAWGVDDQAWGVSASFVDIDLDGFLDLYVANYIPYDLENPKICRNETSVEDYCGPQAFDGAADRLYRNQNGEGFRDITTESGVGSAKGTGMGVVSADFNGDHKLDVFVANDGMPNLLWINKGSGKFEDQGLLAGVAVNREGMTEASMGVDAADFDNDGDEDLFMTHMVRETNTLYINDGTGWFDERTAELRLANPSVRFTSFGSAWFDYDNDGDLDLLVANGGVSFFESPQRTRDNPYPLDRLNQLFAQHNGGFEEVSEESGDVFKQSEVSRGAAFGDIDNDGDTDVLITNNAGPARLLLNNKGHDNAWIGFIPLSKDDIMLTNTRVAVKRKSKQAITRRSRSDGSYASANDARILIGLGDMQGEVDVQVIWPGGKQEHFLGMRLNEYHRIRPGEGKVRHEE